MTLRAARRFLTTLSWLVACSLVAGAIGGVAGATAPRAGPDRVPRERSQAPSPVRTLLVEPTAGLSKFDASIRDAKRSVDLEMYELADPVAERLLAGAAARGVDVRVILDRHGEGARNAPAYGYLSARHIAVVWAPSTFEFDHEKAMVVDTREAWIMTLNLTSVYYANTRDFAILDTGASDVRAIVETFDADFADRPIVPADGADLVWSPTNASPALLSLIARARSSLWVESEELSDSSVVDALVAAARRRVSVHLVMNDTARDASAFDALVRAGARVGTFPGDPGLYIHAKAVVADPGTSRAEAFIGSENFSETSLFSNRELGIVTRSVLVSSRLAAVLERDAARATPWRAVTSPAPAGHASCRVVAVPADDGYEGDYDVDVTSNEPDTRATASDAGDTWSETTDGSGAAHIRLYHTAPGMQIVVTVGAARCTARVQARGLAERDGAGLHGRAVFGGRWLRHPRISRRRRDLSSAVGPLASTP